MDQQHANQHVPHPDMHDDPMVPGGYPFYNDDGSYGMVYPPHMPPYAQVVPPAHPPRSLSTSDISQFQPHFARMAPVGLMPAHSIQAYPQQPMFAPAPEHVGMPLVGSPPASPHVYDPLSPPVSGSETSGELYHSRGSSGAATPDLGSRRNSVSSNRSAHRYNPTPSPSTSSGGRSRARSLSDDDTMGIAETIASTRKEVTRKQRIEAEQRRRDELRDGYAKLKDVLPVSNAKSSKVSLLERATKYIVDLERENNEMQNALAAREEEINRLRELNQKLSLSLGVAPSTIGARDSPASSGMRGASTPPANASPSFRARPLTPPKDESPPHMLTAIGADDVTKEHSSGSDDDF